MKDHAEDYADEINRLLPSIMAGTLRFFGVWFGRPHDNMHRIISAEAENGALKIAFNEGEYLEILEPASVSFASDIFEIRFAKKVIWKWFYYGRPRTPQNLYYFVFETDGSEVRMTTNVDWYVEKQVPRSTEPAVMIF